MIRRFLFLLMMLVFPMSVYGFSDMGTDCTKCHSLSSEEAGNILKELIPNAKVLEIKNSPIKGFWEVDVETGGKKGLIYVDFSKKYLFAGSIVDIKAKRNLSQERFTELNRIDVASIPLDDALILGSKDAKHKIIVFDDPD
jgi:thiol:disulfide interchange protein DsbC